MRILSRSLASWRLMVPGVVDCRANSSPTLDIAHQSVVHVFGHRSYSRGGAALAVSFLKVLMLLDFLSQFVPLVELARVVVHRAVHTHLSTLRSSESLPASGIYTLL